MSSGNLSAVKHYRNLVPDLHVMRAGYDLGGLASDIYLADNKLVSVRMRIDPLDLSDNYVLKVLVKCLEILNLGSGERHGIAELLVCDVKVRHICFDPRY